MFFIFNFYFKLRKVTFTSNLFCCFSVYKAHAGRNRKFSLKIKANLRPRRKLRDLKVFANIEMEEGCQCSLLDPPSKCSYLILSYLSCSLADCWGTTVDFTTSFLHSSQFSAFRSMMFHSRPVHSLMLSSHRFLCLPLRLPPWTVPCRIVLASPDDRVTCPYHFSLRLFTVVKRSSYGLMAFPILAFTSSLKWRKAVSALFWTHPVSVAVFLMGWKSFCSTINYWIFKAVFLVCYIKGFKLQLFVWR